MPFFNDSDAPDLIPIIEGELIEALRESVTISRLVARNTGSDASGVGKTIRFPTPGALTVKDKAQGSPTVTEAPDSSKTDLVLDKHKYVEFGVEDITRSRVRDEVLPQLRDGMISLVEQIEKDLFAQFTHASETVGAQGTSAEAVDWIEINKLLNIAKAPKTNRSLIMGPETESDFLGFDVQANNVRGPEGYLALRDAALGKYMSFENYGSNLVDVDDDDDFENNIAFHRDAIVLATRPLYRVPDGLGVQESTITDPDSDLTFRMHQWYSPSDMAYVWRLDVLYGIKTIRPTQVVNFIANGDSGT